MIDHSSPVQSIKGQGQFTEIPVINLNDWNKSSYEQDDSECKEWDAELIPFGDLEAAVDLWYFVYKKMKQEWIFSTIYRQGFLDRLAQMGFFKRYSRDGMNIMYIRDRNHIIEQVIVARMLDSMKSYIDQYKCTLRVRHKYGYLEAPFVAREEMYNKQSHLVINETFLQRLGAHEVPFLKDTPTVAFYPFRNGIVKVSADDLEVVSYELLSDYCVWKGQVINREFVLEIDYADSHFYNFCWNVSGGEMTRMKALMSLIGYILHGYNDPSRSQAGILYDEEITDTKKPEGGTGKTLIIHAIKQMVPTVIVDGKRHDAKQRFNAQSVREDTRVYGIDDPRKDFPFESLFSALGDGLTIERKKKDEFKFDPVDSPKIIISSNVILATEGSSNKRRQFIVELAPYYKRLIKTGVEQPIKEVHGCVFFSDNWDADEWAKFDRFMLACVKYYLDNGLVPYELKSVASNRLKQTAGSDFYDFVMGYNEGKGLQLNEIYDTTKLFQDFKQAFGVDDREMKQRGFTERLKRFADLHHWQLKRQPGNSNSNIWFEPAT